MEQPARNSKLLRSTQLVYTDQKAQHFHKLDDEIVTQSPLLSKKKKRQSRMGRMRPMSIFGDENASYDNEILPIINKNKASKKEKKAKGEKASKEVEVKPVETPKKEEEKKEEEKDRSMNWADMDEAPVLKQHATFPEPRRRTARMRTLQPSHPDISSKFKFFYASPDCNACDKMTEFCQQVPPPLENRNADTDPLKLSEALTFARKHKEVLVIEKGGCEKILLNGPFDPPAAVLEKKILGKDGRMKTPMCVVGYTMVVGYNEDIMRESLFFGNKSPSSFKRKRKGSLSRPLSSMKRSKN